jgi:hypothetical protein
MTSRRLVGFVPHKFSTKFGVGKSATGDPRLRLADVLGWHGYWPVPSCEIDLQSRSRVATPTFPDSQVAQLVDPVRRPYA